MHSSKIQPVAVYIAPHFHIDHPNSRQIQQEIAKSYRLAKVSLSKGQRLEECFHNYKQNISLIVLDGPSNREAIQLGEGMYYRRGDINAFDFQDIPIKTKILVIGSYSAHLASVIARETGLSTFGFTGSIVTDSKFAVHLEGRVEIFSVGLDGVSSGYYYHGGRRINRQQPHHEGLLHIDDQSLLHKMIGVSYYFLGLDGKNSEAIQFAIENLEAFAKKSPKDGIALKYLQLLAHQGFVCACKALFHLCLEKSRTGSPLRQKAAYWNKRGLELYEFPACKKGV